MCSNYRPPSPEALRHFARGLPDCSYAEEVFPESIGLFLSSEAGGTWRPGAFGLLPSWARPDAGAAHLQRPR